MNDYTVKDSSLYQNLNLHSTINSENVQIRIGMVQEEILNGINDETYYMVDLLDSKGQHLISCVRMSRFGSPYNYEEFTRQAYEIEEGDIAAKGELRHRPGEVVIVACLNGGNSEGIILGSINHPYRTESLPRNNEVAYVSEFNGIETYITKDGEWRQTFRGIQNNVDALKKAPNGEPIPEPEYNLEVGSGYMEWDKTGSWFLTDNAIELPQSVHMDKTNGIIKIISGNTELVINKEEESYSVKNKIFNITSEESFSLTTKKTTIISQDSFELESKDIKTKGKITQKGDVGIEGNIEVKGDTSATGALEQTGDVKVDGSFESTGETKLAGGAKPLITDIVLIMGTGNLGAPVVSSATILTTTMTKAT